MKGILIIQVNHIIYLIQLSLTHIVHSHSEGLKDIIKRNGTKAYSSDILKTMEQIATS